MCLTYFTLLSRTFDKDVPKALIVLPSCNSGTNFALLFTRTAQS